ncbi:GlpM family protein [Pseudobacillus sp. FSL P4-0506]|uniref:GlpM family protein n=1 Tax=unclassified Pseudobacillus TaxID=2619284 RepID=UPI0030FC221D
MSYVVQFAIGGSILVLASLLSKSKYLFLSGVITLLPIMTLINISLQMKNMNLTEFRMTQKNAIVGAFGAVILMSSIFLLSNWVKPLYAVIGASVIYVGYMVGYMCFISQKLSV